MFQLSTYVVEVTEFLFIENSFKLKLKIIGEFGHTLGIAGKPSLRKL
jgi:hypothetical protein